MPLIFINHASADATLARALNNFLQVGCNLVDENIFCTSVEGSGTNTGHLFTLEIRDALLES